MESLKHARRVAKVAGKGKPCDTVLMQMEQEVQKEDFHWHPKHLKIYLRSVRIGIYG